MFTGIIEQLAEVVKIESEESNVHITLASAITNAVSYTHLRAHET